MEQPLRRNQFDMNAPMEGDAGAVPNRGEVSRQAGHILLHESPHGGEISLGDEQPLDPSQQVARTEVPAWYNVKFNAIGQVVEQEYGQAFHQEQRAEQVGNDDGTHVSTVATPGQPASPAAVNPLQSQPVTAPAAPTTPAYAAPVVPVPQLTTPLTASNPIYNAMAHPLQADQPQPINTLSQAPAAVPVQPVAQPLIPEPLLAAGQPVQPAYPSPMPFNGPQMYGSAPQTPLTGAVNPSFAQPTAMPMLPPSPESQEQALPMGKPTRIDAQHLLPMARKHISMYLRSPWVWLAVGILMILYFSGSL